MNKNKGFSMIEMLITLLLTSIGILGMVVVQGKGVEYTQDASNRNAAIELANDLIEIMRSYREEMYVNTPSKGDYTYSELQSSTAVYNGSGALAMSATACPAAALPQTLAEAAGCWLKKVNETLPGASANSGQFKVCPSFAVSGDCAGAGYQGSTLFIQIAWAVKKGECMDGKENSEVCTYSTRLEL